MPAPVMQPQAEPEPAKPAKPVKGKITYGQLAAIFISVSLIFHGLAMLLEGNTAQAVADFAGALGTVGLPRVWVEGWTITYEPPK